MPGFRHPPGADIQWIRQDLRDRYHDGFPILKELLQNADDAGAAIAGHGATQCAFALCDDGLPGAQHPLLRGPGLSVINDGGFTADDANSLTSLGLSNKAGQSAAAGKFGLGLKSVFHWAEAFFYFSPHSFAGDPDIQSSGYDLLNPWSSRDTKTGLHRGWDEEWQRTREDDFRAFRSMVLGIGGSQRWFGLWIPLRRQEHTNDGQTTVLPIENRFPAANLDELLGADWRRRLAETLPLLRRVRAVRICQRSQDAWQTVAEMRVGEDALRMRFGTEVGPATQGANSALGGRIEEVGGSTSTVFRGTESLIALPTLTRLRNHSAWPSQATLGPDGADLQVKEKAEPHGAVIFTRLAVDGQPALRVHQAVFLPLGEPEQVGCTGAWRYNLYLHGFFFVDSGRRGIQQIDNLPDGISPDTAASESQLMQLWNRTLLHELVAPMVLPSLDAFIRQERMQSDEIESLVRAMGKSDTLKKLTEWTCRGQRFIQLLTPHGYVWTNEDWASGGGRARRWLELPRPNFREAELFELLPTLAQLCGEASVSFEGKPRLADGAPVKPSDEELARLLVDVAGSAFQNASHLTYLLRLIPDTRGADSRLITTLVKVANRLLNQCLPEVPELRALWIQFFQRLPAERFVRLPCDSTKATPIIVRALAEAMLPVAVLWEDYQNGDGKGALEWESLLPLLQSLGGLQLVDEVAVRQRSAIVVRLLQACASLQPARANAIETLPLFQVCTPSGASSAASFAELQTASAKGLLFTGGKEWAADLAKAAPTLKPLHIARDVAEILDLGSVSCGVAACVALLRDAPRMAGDFASRKLLFTRILPAAPEHGDDAWAALRCLLHGEISASQEAATLFYEAEASPVLLRLLQKTLLASVQPWRRIPAALMDQLQVNGEQRQHLNLVPASEANIEALITEVGPSKVDCAELTVEDCDYILSRFDEVETIRRLNIHEKSDGHRVRIGPHTYVDDGQFTDLPELFKCLVTPLRDRPGYARFRNDDGSNDLVNRLSWEAVIEIALQHPEPAQWWNAILSAIGHLGNVRVELRDRVRNAAWLPRPNDSPVAPDVLLDLPGAEEELDRLPESILAGQVPLLRLSQSVRDHERFDTFRSTILPTARYALESLANLLQPHPAWSTGLSGDWTGEQVADWVHAVGDASEHALPVARLVTALHAKSTVGELLPVFLHSISGRLAEVAYIDVLKHIVQVHGANEAVNRKKLEIVLLRYLRAVDSAGAGVANKVLAAQGVQLLSKAGEWKSAGQLAPPTEGLNDADVIGEDWSNALQDVVARCRQAGSPHGRPATPENPQTWQVMADEVRSYFEPWRKHLPSPEPIGAFLSLFSSPIPIARLGADYFQSQSAAAVHRWIDEHYKGVLASLAAEFQKQTPNIEVQRGRTTCVVSLLGTPVDARRTERPTTLILGGDPCLTTGSAMMVNGALQPGLRRRVLRLLPVCPGNHSVSDSVKMLRIAAEQVIARTVGTQVNLTPLFDKLSNASQVEVQVAQSLVVESALGLLRQIGGHAHKGIGVALNLWDEARREEASAEALGIRERNRSEEKRRNAQREIRRLLEGDADAHSALLAKVREKLRQYQYDASSVPFELWQNADDAISELEQLKGDAAQAREAGMLIAAMNTEVRLIHFGRLINEFRLSDGPSHEDLGFNRDLEKMVVQSISDKAVAGVRSGAAVTGKFGLGFKSVFLVSDAPEVLSGSVDFVVRGGIYPVQLNESARDQLSETLKAITPDEWRRGTIIRLPLRSNGATEADAVLNLFRRLAPLLVVFSRRIRRLRYRSDNQKGLELRWRPEQLAVGIEIGAIEALEGGLKNALVLSRTAGHDRVQLLLGLDADGFVALPNYVPVFWVTAPTRDGFGYGFAANGPFEPDVGRVQLALQSEKNRQLAEDLADVLGTRLKVLEERSSTNWPAVRDELQLTTHASAYDFWNSLWVLLGKHFAAKCRKEDKSPSAALARRILWESEGDGLQRFYRDCAALPTALWGDYRVLTRLREVRYIAGGALDRELAFRVVSAWKGFQQRVAVAAMCSGSQVATVLERLGALVREVEAVYLTTVVEWELGHEKRADPELATALGKLITPEFLIGLEKGEAGEREESEHKRMVELLQGVSFQAADASWHKASKLVVTAPTTIVAKDELMRAAFAPRECQLNRAYTGSALQFFRASRVRLETDVGQMATWVLKASDQATQVAALRYLLSGEFKDRLAEELRGRKDAANWLWQLANFPWFGACFTTEEQHQIRAYILRLFDEELREEASPPPGPPPQPAREPIHVWTVEELWKWWEQRGKPMGDYTLEGEANWDLFHGGNLPTPEQRKVELKRLLLSPELEEGTALWYRLFGYACLVSAGRHSTELRRFWLERLNPERFWERTSSGEFSDETHEIFERAVTAEFKNSDAGGEQAYFWRRVFYDIRKVRRMVHNEFPAVLLDLVNQGHGGQLRQFLRTGRLNGPDQPRWIGTFGQSANTPLGFIIRELVRLNVITDESVRPSAFFVCRPVLRALAKIGWIDDADDGFSGEDWLARLVKDQVHGPLLQPCYDIPLLHMGITHRGDRMPLPPR